METRKEVLLPQDVIEEILSRVPVKSLLRFRCVSKQWKNLISSSRRFASLHLKRSLLNPAMHYFIINQSGVYDDDRLPLVFLSPANFAPLAPGPDPYHPVVNPVDPRKQPPIFVGSINGLFCLRSFPGLEPDWIVIWNPATKTIRELIPNTKADFYAVAFGWDPIANDHKVFRLCRSLSSGSKGWVEVWSVGGSRSWRSYEIDPMYDVLPLCSTNLILEEEGRTYCIIGRGEEDGDGDIIKYRNLIACFDMVKEEAIRFISLPLDTNVGADSISLVNWKGTLALMCTTVEQPGYIACQVWKIDNYSESSWTKSFTFDLSGIRYIYNLATSISPTQVLISDMGQLHLFDLETKEWQKITVRDDANLKVCYHVESLY